MTCICGEDPGFGPCETHNPEAFAAWLAEEVPRLAKARAEGDPIYRRGVEEMTVDAASVPELAELRAALSDLAREQLDNDWGLVTSMESWPSAWEFALAARDDWRNMVLPYERNALRERLAAFTANNEYPLGDDHDEVSLSGALRGGSSEELRQEAQGLAEIARCAMELERMLRDHAAGWSTTAADYP